MKNFQVSCVLLILLFKHGYSSYFCYHLISNNFCGLDVSNVIDPSAESQQKVTGNEVIFYNNELRTTYSRSNSRATASGFSFSEDIFDSNNNAYVYHDVDSLESSQSPNTSPSKGLLLANLSFNSIGSSASANTILSHQNRHNNIDKFYNDHYFTTMTIPTEYEEYKSTEIDPNSPIYSKLLPLTPVQLKNLNEHFIPLLQCSLKDIVTISLTVDDIVGLILYLTGNEYINLLFETFPSSKLLYSDFNNLYMFLFNLYKGCLELNCEHTPEVIEIDSNEFEIVKLIALSIEYGNVDIYNRLTGRFGTYSPAELYRYFKHNSILLYLSDDPTMPIFNGLTSKIYEFEYKYLDGIVKRCINKKNWMLLKELISHEDQNITGDESNYNGGCLHIIRTVFETTQLIKLSYIPQIINIILQLNSLNENTLASFQYFIEIQQQSQHNLIEYTKQSVQMKSLEYFKTIISQMTTNFIFKDARNIRIGIWDLIPLNDSESKSGHSYDEFMEILVESPYFNIIHAAANQNISLKLWQKFLDLDNQTKRTEASHYFGSFNEICSFYAFDLKRSPLTTSEELLNILGIVELKLWDVLELSILTLNVQAVDALLNHSQYFTSKDMEHYISLARSLCEYVDSDNMFEEDIRTDSKDILLNLTSLDSSDYLLILNTI